MLTMNINMEWDLWSVAEEVAWTECVVRREMGEWWVCAGKLRTATCEWSLHSNPPNVIYTVLQDWGNNYNISSVIFFLTHPAVHFNVNISFFYYQQMSSFEKSFKLHCGENKNHFEDLLLMNPSMTTVTWADSVHAVIRLQSINW